MTGRRGSDGSGGLAGWAYADLILVLFIIGLAGWTATSTALDPVVTTTTTTNPPPEAVEDCGGANPEPLKITLTVDADTTDAELFGMVSQQMRQQGAVNEQGDVLRFNIVLVFAGTGFDTSPMSQDKARDRASEIARRLKNWTKFTDEYTGGRWSEHLLLLGRPDDLYQLTIFPLFCED